MLVYCMKWHCKQVHGVPVVFHSELHVTWGKSTQEQRIALTKMINNMYNTLYVWQIYNMYTDYMYDNVY